MLRLLCGALLGAIRLGTPAIDILPRMNAGVELAASRWSFQALPKWKEHRRAQPVLPVSIPEERNEIVFFKLDGQQDVARRGDGKQQVSVSHFGRSPEGDQESEIDRVANVLVKHWRLESNCLVRLSAQVECDLPQAEKISVANHECARQDGE